MADEADVVEEAVKLLRVSEVKPGDILVIKSDDITSDVVHRLRLKLLEVGVEPKLVVVGIATDDDVALVRDEPLARAVRMEKDALALLGYIHLHNEDIELGNKEVADTLLKLAKDLHEVIG